MLTALVACAIIYKVKEMKGRVQMAYKINEACIQCGACVDTCPVEAISEQEGKHVISDECISCGACVDSCPADAIEED